MARKVVYQSNGVTETWDDEAGSYVKSDVDGNEVERRELTRAEYDSLDPQTLKLRALSEVVDQLILDSLLGGMF